MKILQEDLLGKKSTVMPLLTANASRLVEPDLLIQPGQPLFATSDFFVLLLMKAYKHMIMLTLE